MLAGAATCFYSFVGFDTIATSGEEATHPTRHVPIAIVTSLVICLLAYIGVSSVLTMIVPWTQLASTAALPKAFAQRGILGAEYVIAVGGMCGLTASIMGSIFPLPRSIYAMAQDGLVFRWLGHVSKLTDTPVLAALVSGVLVAVSALLFDLESLVEMMSIGTLMAYTLVAISVLVLHYQREQVGLTADDMTSGVIGVTGVVGEGTGLGRGLSNGASCERISLSEDTGLLRVGEGSNRVRYVPANTTTVVKRIKPPQDSDEELPTATPPATTQRPATPDAQSQPPPVRPKEASVVEEYRARVQQQQQQEQQQRQQQQQQLDQQLASRHLADARLTTTGSTFHRIDSAHSISNLSQIFNAGIEAASEPTSRTRRVVIASVTILVLVWAAFCALTIYGEEHLIHADWWAIMLVCVMIVVVLVLVVVIIKQPRNRVRLNFSTPFVPVLPLASIMINIYLMITLQPATWVRFAVWMSLGRRSLHTYLSTSLLISTYFLT